MWMGGSTSGGCKAGRLKPYGKPAEAGLREWGGGVRYQGENYSAEPSGISK